MRQVMVRYRVKPGRESENEALVRAVYQELAHAQPDGFRYTTFRFDGRSFMHVAVTEGDRPPPLPALAAFRAFTRDIEARCEEPPVVTELEEVGSYRFW